MKDIQRTFMYHGAEHKCINCIEHGLELNVENVRKSSRQHKRCGTSSTPANGRWTAASRTVSSAVRRMCHSRGCICYCRRWRLSASAIPMSSSMWGARTMGAFRRLRAMPMNGTSTACCAKTTSTTMLFLPEA